MDPHTVEITLKACLSEISERLDEAAGIARAAKACGETGSAGKGLEVALDIEQLI